ncbi:MAG: ABC transporter permease, partial [Bacteroidales bacterium]|nr:ABC transporter permease [Bacteroidales bacterium]
MKIFRKTGVSTLINILGMSVAFAAAIILLVQVRWDTTYDANFEGHGQVFRMENNWLDDGPFSAMFSRPLIELTKDSSPNIAATGTMMGRPEQVYYREGDRESAITVSYVLVDSTLFNVFPFEWVEGSAQGFTAPGAIVISEVVAQTFFGSGNALGNSLQTADGATARVVGVFKDTPRNYSLHYGIFENLGDEWMYDSSEWSFEAFVKLKDPSQAEETASSMLDELQKHRNSDSEEELAKFRKGFRLSRLHDAHYERDVRASNISSNKAITVTLAVIATLLILIAIINFINFAFAEIPFRIKNINTRKVLGEGRGSLIGRQLLHAGLIALIAFALACLIMHIVAGTSWASYVSDSLALKDNVGILALMLGVALASAVIAGIAPALYSTAQPAALVLKGSYAMSV